MTPSSRAVAESVEANPDAAVALAVLLRGGAERSVVEGLVAESATYALLQAGPEHQRWLASRPTPSPRPPRTAPSPSGATAGSSG